MQDYYGIGILLVPVLTAAAFAALTAAYPDNTIVGMAAGPGLGALAGFVAGLVVLVHGWDMYDELLFGPYKQWGYEGALGSDGAIRFFLNVALALVALIGAPVGALFGALFGVLERLGVDRLLRRVRGAAA